MRFPSPSETLIGKIREGASPFGAHPVLSGNLGVLLAEEEWERAVEEALLSAGSVFYNFTRDDACDPHALMFFLRLVSADIRECEDGKREVLEEAALRAVAGAYELDENVVSSLILGSEPKNPSLRAEKSAAKRMTLDAIICGTGLNRVHRSLILAISTIDDINENLFRFYTFFISLVSALRFFGSRYRVEDHYMPRLGKARLKPREQPFVVLVQELCMAVAGIHMGYGTPDDGGGRYPYLCMMSPPLAARLQKALLDFALVMQSPERPDPGMDLMYTRGLLATLSEEDLHAALGGLLSDREDVRKLAGEALRRCLQDAASR